MASLSGQKDHVFFLTSHDDQLFQKEEQMFFSKSTVYNWYILLRLTGLQWIELKGSKIQRA